jgi:hypothetical protein
MPTGRRLTRRQARVNRIIHVAGQERVCLLKHIRFACLIGAILTVPLSAQQPMPGEKTTTDREAVGKVVTSPLSDVNLKRRGVPPELIAIRDRPYDLGPIRTCRQIIAEVQMLDSVLGFDVDQIEVNAAARERREGAASVAGGLIATLIPFRALIREVSGANKAEEEYRAAIYAGVVRRGFLKGYGLQRRCRAPGRPATDLEQAQDAAAQILKEPDGK